MVSLSCCITGTFQLVTVSLPSVHEYVSPLDNSATHRQHFITSLGRGSPSLLSVDKTSTLPLMMFQKQKTGVGVATLDISEAASVASQCFVPVPQTKCKSGSFEFSQLILVLRLPFIYVEKQNHANKCDAPSSFRHPRGRCNSQSGRSQTCTRDGCRRSWREDKGRIYRCNDLHYI